MRLPGRLRLDHRDGRDLDVREVALYDLVLLEPQRR
jgi:hypothetical protein